MTPSPTQPLVLDGSSLDLSAVGRVASGTSLAIDAGALARAEGGHRLAAELASTRPVYGRTTGVGAARGEDTTASVSHGLSLLRSHAAGWGEPFPPATVRAALAVRANQLLAGGSGASPELATALVELAAGPEGDLPQVHRHGSLGTGDLTALAEVGLTLIGERPGAGGRRTRRLDLTSADALPLMSSNAFALAETALHTASMDGLARAANTVCALTWLALNGNPEAVSEHAAAATPFRGAGEVARSVRVLLAPQDFTPAHIQDFFGLRTWPQVHGPLVDALMGLRRVVEVSMNTASENPLFTVGTRDSGESGDGGGAGGAGSSGGGRDGGQVTHHGGFHAAYLALAVDSALLALTRSAQANHSRISHILTDGDSGLPLFLSDATQGSSGLLIGEYVAASALSIIRGNAAAPSSVLTAEVSAGIEDDASFAGRAAVRLGESVAAYQRLLAVELVCAARALRIGGARPVGELGDALERCQGLPDGLDDRDLAEELSNAERIVEEYAGGAGPAR